MFCVFGVIQFFHYKILGGINFNFWVTCRSLSWPDRIIAIKRRSQISIGGARFGVRIFEKLIIILKLAHLSRTIQTSSMTWSRWIFRNIFMLSFLSHLIFQRYRCSLIVLILSKLIIYQLKLSHSINIFRWHFLCGNLLFLLIIIFLPISRWLRTCPRSICHHQFLWWRPQYSAMFGTSIGQNIDNFRHHLHISCEILLFCLQLTSAIFIILEP